MKRLITFLTIGFLLLPFSFATAASTSSTTNTTTKTIKEASKDTKAPTCDIEVGFEYAVEELTVEFTNISVGSWDNVVWEFGDGETSANVKTSEKGDAKYTYTKGGMYTFCLTAENKETKCGEKFCGQIYIFE